MATTVTARRAGSHRRESADRRVLLAQLNPVDDRLGLNLRVGYNFSEGSDLWLVYDEGFNTEREALPGEPRIPRSDSPVLLVELTRTFTP